MGTVTSESGELWYVAYGSNLSARRLQRYLDHAPVSMPPTDARTTTLPHRLFFAHDSSIWTGGTAFVDPVIDDREATLATAWLVRTDQFLSIAAQESGRAVIDLVVDDLPGEPGEVLRFPQLRYGAVLACASPDERPAYTVTTPADPLPAPTTPHASYLDTIVEGLVLEHGLRESDARAYLAERI